MVIARLARDFLPGAPHWRSPGLQYNVCAPVNAVSAAATALAQDLNVHNINTDFAGHCLSAERAISCALADLVGLPAERVRGLLTFGGTGSNMYAMKLAINKAVPNAGRTGVPPTLHICITSEAHFSHQTSADWLGIGVDRVLKVPADADNRSRIDDAERQAREILRSGGIVAAFTVNGGTVYDHVFDDVAGFAALCDRLVREFHLAYRPHLHVDSVIGWVWLTFRGYDFADNPLGLPDAVLPWLRSQTEQAANIAIADSWGVDFHKALGGCPTPCAMFVSNDARQLRLLSKGHRGICDTHQLGGDWSLDDPSDITLETSRSAGPALAALASFWTLGRNGYRRFLANQIFATQQFRTAIGLSPSFLVANPHSLGFDTLVVMRPPGEAGRSSWQDFQRRVEEDDHFLDTRNEEARHLFEWCTAQGRPLPCSFSRSFRRTSKGRPIAALKYYFVSPHMTAAGAETEASRLQEKLEAFRLNA